MTYPYSIKKTESMSQKVQYNNDIDNKIDRFFNFIIKREDKNSKYFNEFEEIEFWKVLKNIDIDNKFVKPIVDGLVLSEVIADDNIANMFYAVLGKTEKNKNPYTEVYVFKGEKIIKWIQNYIGTDI